MTISNNEINKEEMIRHICSVLINKSFVYEADDNNLWNFLCKNIADINKHFMTMFGIYVEIDDFENIAYLTYDNENGVLPEIVTKQKYNYAETLLLAYLRSRYSITENMNMNVKDMSELKPCVVTKNEIYASLEPYFNKQHDDPRKWDSLNKAINVIESIGILKTITKNESYVIKKVIKIRIDMNTMNEILTKFKAYIELNNDKEETGDVF